MKFVADFTLKHEEMPIDYRRIYISYIKYCLTDANSGRYFDEYYTPGKEKNFCISVRFSSPVFSKDSIRVVGKKLKLIISTDDTRTGFILFSAIAGKKNEIFKLPLGNSMKMNSIRQMSEMEVTSEKILISMDEPLCIRIHNKETNRDFYVSSERDIFEEESSKVVKAQLLAAGFPEQICDVKITPIDARKVIIKHYGINIESSIGSFMLEGNVTVLNYLLKSGMGSRKSTGFGMMKLLAEE